MAQGEIYELEAQRAREEQNRVQAESSLKLALLDLAQIMELEDFSTFDLSAPSVESIINESVLLSTSEIFQSALLTRPEIKAAQYRLESSEKEVLMARSQLYPSLSFGANIGTGYYNIVYPTIPSDPDPEQHEQLGRFQPPYPHLHQFQIKNNIGRLNSLWQITLNRQGEDRVCSWSSRPTTTRSRKQVEGYPKSETAERKHSVSHRRNSITAGQRLRTFQARATLLNPCLIRLGKYEYAFA